MKFKITILTLCTVIFYQSLSAAELDAEVSWSEVRQLSLPVSGLVKNINVSAGMHVAAGETMLSLDCGSYQSQLSMRKAIAEGLQPSVETALKEKELADELFARTVLSEIEHRNAELIYLEKKARYDAAFAEQKQMKWQVKHCDLVADSALIVLDLNVSAGQYYSLLATTPVLMTVASNKKMLVTSRLSLPLKNEFKVGQSARVKLEAKRYETKIKSISYAVDNYIEIAVEIKAFDSRLLHAKTAKIITK